jgi:hypothetical protein
MARVGKRKIGTWSYKQQRELIKLAAASAIARNDGEPDGYRSYAAVAEAVKGTKP